MRPWKEGEERACPEEYVRCVSTKRWGVDGAEEKGRRTG